MLYSFLKILVRLLRPLFCRLIVINQPERLREKGPLLLAANHPNSFLDAIILDTLFASPIWSLARGDVFKNKFIARLLKSLYILPVYRTSEGVENLNNNYQTFEDCRKIFRESGLVLIFSEGICINEWHLRPLKKGTARLAMASWEEGIPLKVLPVSLNYSSFRFFGKNLFIHFGKPIEASDIPSGTSDGARTLAFNQALSEELAKGVYEISPGDTARQKELLERKPSLLTFLLLLLPAIVGAVVHAPLFVPVRWYTARKSPPDHHDSVMMALLLISYLPYLAILSLLLYLFTGSIFSWAAIPVAPFTAWAYVQLKPQIPQPASEP